ncbi:UDP-glucuronic acid decarboxylase 1-like [Styela clava]|uniref:UDP-glucuronic acid decarboxylase 1-like n=1 Tax=Styela clava TaxID=7725 RepID=UPI00193ADA70|nr:UDP-glucuronic acid decarboxylase 1-like [Styela clava]
MLTNEIIVKLRSVLGSLFLHYPKLGTFVQLGKNICHGMSTRRMKYLVLLLFLVLVIVAVKSGKLSKDGKALSEEVLEHKPAVNNDHNDDIDKQLRKVAEENSYLKLMVESLQKSIKPKHPEVKFLPEQERKRILVTGGAGFVGSHLVDKLMSLGHEVTVVDNFFTGRKRNVEHWIGHENFELIHHDVVTPLFIEVDEIYHLACPASPPHYMYNPIKTIKTSSIGTLNMLGLAKRVNARLLLASTSEVYGDPEEHPQKEEYWGHVNPIGPRACYDEGKRVAETMCYAYKSQDNVEVRVARIFNTFGPRMHMADGRVVSNFVLQALKGEDITIYGNGKQTRSFQYVSDLVKGLIALMESDVDSPVNIGNPKELTIQEFAELIKKMTSSSSKIINKEAATDDPRKRKPDITKAKTLLHWEPMVSLSDGLNSTIAYFKAELLQKSENKRNVFLPPKESLL